MKRTIRFFTLIVGCVVSLAASDFSTPGRSRTVPADTLSFHVPSNFPRPVYDFANNAVTRSGFELGRVLFYDPRLSKDGSISCANCHQQFAAFANLDHAISHGVDECQGTRNTPGLFNLAWQKTFMWDGGVTHIELSPLNALTSSCEMANPMDAIIARLSGDTAYRERFEHAFGSGQVNSQRILRALAQFNAMLVSANSRYDKHVRGEPGGTFTAEEETGYALFKTNCSTCHNEPLFTDGSYRNNGLDLISDDPGRDSITNVANDRGKFRVPSLRNSELTAPYMHDGRFETLDQVLEHYISGVKAHVNLAPELKKDGRAGILLSRQEQKAILTFLKTLTDREFVNDKRFQQP